MVLRQLQTKNNQENWGVFDRLGNKLIDGTLAEASVYYEANKHKEIVDAHSVDGNLVDDKHNEIAGVKLNAGWKDLKASFNASKTTQQASPTWEAFKGGIYAYNFSAGSVEELIMTPYHYDHDQEKATLSHIHVHWATSEASSGTVRWGFEITYAKGHGQEAFGDPFFVYVEQEAEVDQTEFHFVAEDVIGILGAGELEPDTIILMRCFRDGTHINDTYPAKAWAFTADFHYRSNHETTIGKRPDFDVVD
jgi:hypothetical protein